MSRAHKFALVSAMLAGYLSISTPAAATQSCPSISPEIAEMLTLSWTTAMSRSDDKSLVGMYADDAIVISPAFPNAQHRPAEVRRHIEMLATRFRLVGQVKRTLRTGCNTIVDFGEMRLRARRNGRDHTFGVNYSRVFERRAGYWTITLDHMTNADHVAQPVLAKRPAYNRKARADLNRLVRSVGHTRRPQPQVAGMVMRLPESSSLAVIPPMPRLVGGSHEPSQMRIGGPKVAAVAAKSKPARFVRKAKVSKRKRFKSATPDWARSMKGFGN